MHSRHVFCAEVYPTVHVRHVLCAEYSLLCMSGMSSAQSLSSCSFSTFLTKSDRKVSFFLLS